MITDNMYYSKCCTIQLNMWVAYIPFLSVISLTDLKTTLLLCLLLKILHDRAPCEYNNKLNAWAADNFASFDMLL